MSGHDNLPAGPALDAAVRRALYGLNYTYCTGPIRELSLLGGHVCAVCGPQPWPDDRHLPAPPYSTDWGAAGQVVEALRGRGYVVTVKADGLRRPGSNAYTVIVDNLPRVDAPTAPLAICRAALAALQEAP